MNGCNKQNLMIRYIAMIIAVVFGSRDIIMHKVAPPVPKKRHNPIS